jgi:hypothetical protein
MRPHTLLAALALLGLAVAPTAAAAPAPARSADFTIQASNGYRLHAHSERGTLTIVAADARPPIATISATGGISAPNRGNVTSTTYRTEASRDPRRIEADLGALGHLSLTFRPSGKSRVTQLGRKGKGLKCVSPRRVVRRLGSFEGSISFHGEDDYTAVEAVRAPGSIGTYPFRRCPLRIDPTRVFGRPPPQRLGHLTAHSRGPAQSLFTALGDGLKGSFSVSVTEPRGDEMIVLRYAQAIGGRRSFRFDARRGTATVAPPAPFAGAAHAALGSGGHGASWSGSLSVSFPGMTVPLTGSSFRTSLDIDR